MKILFLVPYPLNESPSQRFRFEQYFKSLEGMGYRYSVQSFLNSRNWRLFYQPGKSLSKFWALTLGLCKRLIIIPVAPSFDFIFVHREIAPLGPPVVEWFLAKILRKRIIYDFDDAIWITDNTAESRLIKLAKWRQKVGAICRWSYRVSCGNDYLASFARKYNKNVVINPTTIDTLAIHNPALYNKSETINTAVVIGWTGSHSTLKYLNESFDILYQIEQKFPEVKVMVIADRKPDLKLRSLHFVPWNAETEIADLMRFDIGIMPLPNDNWSKGKCGFKVLQYMALEIPSIASAVGVNNKIIDHGNNGFLCDTPEEWLSALTQLIEDRTLREKMGEHGRRKIVTFYSVESNSGLFLKLFE